MTGIPGKPPAVAIDLCTDNSWRFPRGIPVRNGRKERGFDLGGQTHPCTGRQLKYAHRTKWTIVLFVNPELPKTTKVNKHKQYENLIIFPYNIRFYQFQPLSNTFS